MEFPESVFHMKSNIMKIIFMLSICLLFNFGYTQSKKEPVIDIHLHSYISVPPDVPAAWAVDEAKALRSPASAQAHLDLVLEEMERNNIVKAVVSSPSLDALENWRKTAPEKFIMGIRTEKGLPVVSPDSLQILFDNGKIGVLDELGLQYHGLRPDDPRLEPYFVVAEKNNIPVCLHTGLGPPGAPFNFAPEFRVKLGRPELFEPVLIKHPKLRAFLAHAGWPYLEETIALMYIYEDLYVDIGVLCWALPEEVFHSTLRQLVEAGFGKRILFGSDQMIWPGAISMAVDNVKKVPFLSEEQKRDILYNNALKFLALEDKGKQ